MNITQSEIEMLGRNWPEQRVERYDGFYEIWRSQFPDLRPRSCDDYAVMGAHWCKFANGKNLNPRLMLDWHLHVMSILRPGSLSKKISMSRVGRHHSVVRKFLAWLKTMGVIEHDPSMALPPVSHTPPPPRKTFSHDEYKRIVAFGSARPTYHCQTWLTILSYHTGMSLVDCAYLKWDEVVLSDDGPSYIHKPRAKMRTRLGRQAIFTVPIVAGGELWQWIKRLESRRHKTYSRTDGIEYVHDDAVLWYECPEPKISERLRRFFAKALSWQGLGKRSFRHLRNTFCSRLINSGSDSLLVAQMTGHQRLEQLSEYVLPDIRALQDAVVRGMRWIEKDSGPDLKPRFLVLPPPPPTTERTADEEITPVA